MTTVAAGSTVAPPRPLAGTLVERLGWVPVAFLALVMTAFGLMAFLGGPGRDTAVTGSGCCNGHRFSEVAPWAYDYTGEIARYMASYMVLSGVLLLVVVAVGLRRHQRWAWFAAWTLPALFSVHAFVLGAGTFDVVTTSIALAGLLLLVRPVFGNRLS